MSKFSITIDDTAVNQQIAAMSAKFNNLTRPFNDAGEGMKILIDKYFARQTGPDGQPWAKNELSTLRSYLKERNGFTKAGNVSSRGKQLIDSKKVLRGITGDLRRQIAAKGFADGMVLYDTMKYAAIHQWGGPAGRGLRTILPARPFMPVTPDGKDLVPEARKILIAALARHLTLA